MKNIIKYSILFLIFAVSTISAHKHDNQSIITIDSQDNLKNLFEHNDGPSAISFHMPGCGYCMHIQPLFEDLANNDEFGHITFYSVNGSALQAPKHAQEILNEQIPGYPTIFFMNQGEIIDKQIGGTKNAKDVIIQKLNKLSNQPGQKKPNKNKHAKPDKMKKAASTQKNTTASSYAS